MEKKITKKIKEEKEKVKKTVKKTSDLKKKTPPKRVSLASEKKKIGLKKGTISPKKEKEKKEKGVKYFEAIGRRKSAIARIRLFTQGDKKFLVNDQPYKKYFTILEHQQIAQASLERMKSLDRFGVSAKVKGGGLHAQAEAIRYGVARALLKFNPDFRKKLRKAGFLTRDPRVRERKKFGLKRARRAPQWKKR